MKADLSGQSRGLTVEAYFKVADGTRYDVTADEVKEIANQKVDLAFDPKKAGADWPVVAIGPKNPLYKTIGILIDQTGQYRSRRLGNDNQYTYFVFVPPQNAAAIKDGHGVRLDAVYSPK